MELLGSTEMSALTPDSDLQACLPPKWDRHGTFSVLRSTFGELIIRHAELSVTTRIWKMSDCCTPGYPTILRPSNSQLGSIQHRKCRPLQHLAPPCHCSDYEHCSQQLRTC
eukprot:6193398-Pleurochrysis_carterae.AAC.2